MDFSSIKLFNMMQTRMAYLSERQDVLSQNIANIDTPGYRPRDLPELDFHKLALIEARRMDVRRTSADHQFGSRLRTPQFRVQESQKFYEQKPVENAVILEEQMAKVAENQFNYQMTTNLYRKTAEIFGRAIGSQ